jgi:hypothetical protein
MDPRAAASLALLKRQRSHVLFVLGNASSGHEPEFRDWFMGAYPAALSAAPHVLGLRLYEQHEVDVTAGQFPRLPFRYLSICELSLDGAQQADPLIRFITELHASEVSARAPATWLYYPACEKVGRAATTSPCLLTIAFANGVPGHEDEFKEWYATRHIRHALNIPALVSGQCFERTRFQMPGATEVAYSTLAVYEQEDTPESLLESLRTIPESTFDFPTLDLTRFAESVFQPLGELSIGAIAE